MFVWKRSKINEKNAEDIPFTKINFNITWKPGPDVTTGPGASNVWDLGGRLIKFWPKLWTWKTVATCTLKRKLERQARVLSRDHKLSENFEGKWYNLRFITFELELKYLKYFAMKDNRSLKRGPRDGAWQRKIEMNWKRKDAQKI